MPVSALAQSTRTVAMTQVSEVNERLAAWEASPITTLCVTTFDPVTVQVMAELVLGADAGHPERTISLPPPEPAPAAPGSAAGPASAVQGIFDHMTARVGKNPNLVQQVRASFQSITAVVPVQVTAAVLLSLSVSQTQVSLPVGVEAVAIETSAVLQVVCVVRSCVLPSE